MVFISKSSPRMSMCTDWYAGAISFICAATCRVATHIIEICWHWSKWTSPIYTWLVQSLLCTKNHISVQNKYHITLCPCISHTYLDLIRVLHVSDIYRTVKKNISTVNAVLTTALLNDASLMLCKVHWVFCIQLILLSFQNTHTHTCDDCLINLSVVICLIPVCAMKHRLWNFPLLFLFLLFLWQTNSSTLYWKPLFVSHSGKTVGLPEKALWFFFF